MRYLIDTQIAIWAEVDPRRMPPRAWKILGDDRCDLAFSVVTIWEKVIKAARGRPDFAVDPVALRAALIDDNVSELPVSAAHVLAVATLAPIHRDPLDRLLVALAHAEGVRLLTGGATLGRYGAWVEVV